MKWESRTELHHFSMRVWLPNSSYCLVEKVNEINIREISNLVLSTILNHTEDDYAMEYIIYRCKGR